MNEKDALLEELTYLRKRVLGAKETLGMGGFDCVYLANKQLETVLFRLNDIINAIDTQGESTCQDQ